ncbi:MAG: ATP-binding protein [Pseudomonadota bacterium]
MVVSLGRQFGVQSTLRAIALVSVMLLLSFLVFRTSLVITPLVTGVIGIALVVEFVFFVRRTNREVARFFDSIRHADFSHRVDPSLQGAGFQDLARSMRDVVERLQRMRRSGEDERLRLRALVEHVPIPMFSVVGFERVVLHNHAARRFFAAKPVTTVEDLERFGPELATAVRDQLPGQSSLVRLYDGDNLTERMTLSLTEIQVGQEHQRLVTLQSISDALAASELEAWQQMAQVLAHEIMNSLTPVASLAETANTLLASDTPAERQQARDAIATVAERASSLMSFVQGYRRFSRLPAPQLESIDVGSMLSAMAAFVAVDLEQAGIDVAIDTPAAGLELQADRQQLEQLLINLLRNAIDALATVDAPAIQLRARLGRHGRPIIEVADNGPGIDAQLRERVFVPYFSTRKGGSGVGLSLTRQVMHAHEGSVSVGESEAGGALVTLRF